MTPKRFFLVLLGSFGVLVALAGGGYYLALGQLSAKSTMLASGLAAQADADKQVETLDRLKH